MIMFDSSERPLWCKDLTHLFITLVKLFMVQQLLLLLMGSILRADLCYDNSVILGSDLLKNSEQYKKLWNIQLLSFLLCFVIR